MNKGLTKQIEINVKQDVAIRAIKKGIWLYVLLLIFEGALRKWFLPFLATPLLIVRDPVAIWLIYTSWRQNLIPKNPYVIAMTFIGVLGVVTALVFGHHSIVVAIYGARILLFHFPVMFIMGAILTRQDVLKIGKVILIISIPMIILTGLQFYSPQSAWVNRGVGGDMEGAGFSGAMGFFRPPGTFSFTNGNTMFFSLVACFVFYFWVSQSKINKVVLIGATLGLFASIPISISRTLLFSILITIVFTVMAAGTKPRYLSKIIGAFVMSALLLFILNQLEFFQTATEAFTTRIDAASDAEGGLEGTLGERYLGGFIRAIQGGTDMPFFGYGIGMGTNAGSQMLTGERLFLISEEEWGRLIGEMGTLLGLSVIIIRVVFSIKMSWLSFKNMRQGDFLPWILLSFALLIIPQGQWAQPTALGFSTIIGGLLLAALKAESNLENNG